MRLEKQGTDTREYFFGGGDRLYKRYSWDSGSLGIGYAWYSCSDDDRAIWCLCSLDEYIDLERAYAMAKAEGTE